MHAQPSPAAPREPRGFCGNTMHSFNHGCYTVIYNSDFSGDAVFVHGSFDPETRIPCSVLIAFVAEYVRNSRISELEQADDLELLGIVPRA